MNVQHKDTEEVVYVMYRLDLLVHLSKCVICVGVGITPSTSTI